MYKKLDHSCIRTSNWGRSTLLEASTSASAIAVYARRALTARSEKRIVDVVVVVVVVANIQKRSRKK